MPRAVQVVDQLLQVEGVALAPVGKVADHLGGGDGVGAVALTQPEAHQPLGVRPGQLTQPEVG